MSDQNEPFVPQSDRPPVRRETRLTDLTVDDLYVLFKHWKVEKHESVFELKSPHNMKLENLKAELPYKLEHPDIPVGPHIPVPDPVINAGIHNIAQGIAGLTAQVNQLASEVAQLKATTKTR